MSMSVSRAIRQKGPADIMRFARRSSEKFSAANARPTFIADPMADTIMRCAASRIPDIYGNKKDLSRHDTHDIYFRLQNPYELSRTT